MTMTTRQHADPYDVAVVGFGPSGAVCAALLGTMGLRTFACDRSREVYDKPRALALDHEILRVFQQVGVLDDVLPHVEPFTPSEYFGADGQLIRRMTMVEPPYPQGFTPSNVFTQPDVEAALRKRVQSLPNVDVELGVEVTQVTQDRDAATLSLKADDGTTRELRARYAIGCDGAWSLVRETSGMKYEDLQFDEPWLVVDVLVNDRGLRKLPKTSVQYCNPARPCSFLIGPKNHRRWEISLNEGEDPKLAATPEQTWKYLQPWLTPDDAQLWRQASYRFHALVADRWRNGRIFIAGDAAHQQPPFLGQGMCQGVRDVANLAWKLAAVLKGEVRGDAAQELLDSYGIERKQHVRELTTRIKGIGAVICERDPAQARARDSRLLAEAGGVVKDTPRQDVIPPLQSGLLSSRPHAANGTLFPQPWLRVDGERKRFDDVVGTGWVLALAPQMQAEQRSAWPGLRVASFADRGLREDEDVVDAWMRRYAIGAALVRPDHYVFGVASNAAELADLLAEARARLGL